MTRKKKSTGTPDEGMRHVANVLLCPHEWGTLKSRMVRAPGRGKPFTAMVGECHRCGAVRVDHDGISSMYPRQS